MTEEVDRQHDLQHEYSALSQQNEQSMQHTQEVCLRGHTEPVSPSKSLHLVAVRPSIPFIAVVVHSMFDVECSMLDVSPSIPFIAVVVHSMLDVRPFISSSRL